MAVLFQLHENHLNRDTVWWFISPMNWLRSVNMHDQTFEHATAFYRAHWLAKNQRQFPVGFPVRMCALYLLFINIFHDVVAHIESRCVIEATHVFLLCSLSSRWKNMHLHWSARVIFPARFERINKSRKTGCITCTNREILYLCSPWPLLFCVRFKSKISPWTT